MAPFSSLATISQDSVITASYLNQNKSNTDDLNARLSSSAITDIPNGGFEVDSDSDGVPDSVTIHTQPVGGSISIETTSPLLGAKSLAQTRNSGVGNHAGIFKLEYVDCSEFARLILYFLHKSSAAGITNKVWLYWFQKNKTACSTPSTLIYNSAANPTTATMFAIPVEPPADARYFRVYVAGATADTNVAGTAYWDGFSILGGYAGGEMVVFKTIAEQSTNATSWTDASSFTVSLPPLSANSIVRLTFLGAMKNASATAGQRFRVGSVYSNEYTLTGASYVERKFEITMVGNAGGDISVVQQLQTDDGLTATYGKKDVPFVLVEILSP